MTSFRASDIFRGMETVRTQEGKTAPNPECGFFMPKNPLLPVVACGLQIQEGRRGLHFPSKINMKDFPRTGSNQVVCSGSARETGGILSEAKMPVVQVENELPSTWSRRTCVSKLWAYMAAHGDNDVCHSKYNLVKIPSKEKSRPQMLNLAWAFLSFQPNFSHYLTL